jgi:hypothetical protein
MLKKEAIEVGEYDLGLLLQESLLEEVFQVEALQLQLKQDQ